MPKSKNGSTHKKRVAEYRKMLKANKDREKREFQKYLQMKQQEFMMKQQMEEENKINIDSDLIDEAGEFKLED